MLQILATYEYDFSACLVNCTNNGVCILDTITQKYICQCIVNFGGQSCQTDTRICSTFPCLNKGTCLDLILNNASSSKCQCVSNFYGINCENEANMCHNQTCSGNGYCTFNSSEITCLCFNGFSGMQCELEKNSVKILHYVQISSVLLCFTCIIITICIIIMNDMCNLFIAKSKNKSHKKKTSKIFRFKYIAAKM